MTSPTHDPVVLEAVRDQFLKAEEETRQAAEALRRIASASDQLDSARLALGVAHDGLRADGRSLLLGVEALQQAVRTVESATGELAKAEPARLAGVVESMSATLLEQLGRMAAALRAHAEKSESWQQQTLVTLGQVSGQIRQDVRNELLPSLAAIAETVSAAAGERAREASTMSIALEKSATSAARGIAELHSRQVAESSALASALDSVNSGILIGIHEASSASASEHAAITAAIERASGSFERDSARLRECLDGVEAARQRDASALRAMQETGVASTTAAMDAAKTQVVRELRLIAALLIASLGFLGFVLLRS